MDTRKKQYRLKVSPDNTITIKPIEQKTSWSREEVVEKGRDLLNLLEIEEFDVQEWFDRWKENL